MPLVDYSDSSDDDNDVPHPAKAPRKPQAKALDAEHPPPLPAAFHNLYTVAPRLSARDDPSVHGGRIRAIPHEKGNWPTHIFLEWHLSPSEFEAINKLLGALNAGPVSRYNHHNSGDDEAFKLDSFLISELNVQLPLHLSLSRPIILRTEEKGSFMAMLEEKVGERNIRAFSIRFTSLVWVPNQEKTRWFLILKASAILKPSPSKAGSPHLLSLLDVCNRTVEAFGQPGLYLGNHNATSRRPSQSTSFFSHSPPPAASTGVTRTIATAGDPSTDEAAEHTITDEGFHVSIGWSLREPPAALQKDMQDTAEEYMNKVKELVVGVNAVKAKIGNVVHVIELDPDRF